MQYSGFEMTAKSTGMGYESYNCVTVLVKDT